MRVVLDLQGAQSDSRRRGIGRYSRNLALAMARDAGPHALHVLLNGTFADETRWLAALLGEVLPASHIHVWYGPGQHAANSTDSAGRRRAAEHIRAAAIGALSPDILLVASLFEGFGDDAVTLWPQCVTSPPTVAVCYDMIPLISPDFHFPSPLAHDWYHARLDQMRGMLGLLAISESSQREAAKALAFPQERIAPILAGVEAPFRPAPVDTAALARYGLEPGFVLCIGTVEPRKNLDRLIRAYATLPPALRARHRLVANGWNDPSRLAALEALASGCGLAPSEYLLLRTFVPEPDLRALYRACGVAVSPSLHEGFGLSAAEAMACGAPTIGSNTTSLPEVIGDARALFDPADPASIAERLTAVLTDPGLRQSLVEHGLDHVRAFTWTLTAQRAWRALERFASEAHRTARAPAPCPARPSLAVVTPAWDLPERLPTSWTDAYDVEIVSWETVSVRAGWSTWPPDRFQSKPFDRVLYWPRDEPRHARLMMTLLPAYPGVVVAGAMPLGDVLDEALAEPEATVAAATLDVLGWGAWPAPLAWADLGAIAAVGIVADDVAAEAFPAAIEAAYASSRLAVRDACVRRIAAGPVAPHDAPAIARAVAASFPSAARPALLLDVSTIARFDAGTGVQRVVREIVRHLGLPPQDAYRLEPVAVSGPTMRRAGAFAARLFRQPKAWAAPGVVTTHPGDTFVALDLTLHDVDGLAQALRQVRRTGGRSCVVVYDLLPVRTPAFFPETVGEAFPRWLRMIATEADRLLCISRAVADELRTWLAGSDVRRMLPLEVCWFHLGADFRPEAADDAPSGITVTGPTFLMVGTLEPRKGHKLAVAAFEALWREEVDATLVIAGKSGWLMDEFAAGLRAHTEFGRRLRWLNEAGDAQIAALYQSASALIMASEGEGFGLPLVEAARAGLPVLARDVPVYREVAGDGARYFSGSGPAELARVVRDWIKERAAGTVPDPGLIRALTWAEAAEAFREAALGPAVYYAWGGEDSSAT